MAVDDFLTRDTDAFVLPSKAYYPTKIPIAHYQLRHFISCSEPDLLYYASGANVYCLNAATRTQAHVTTLPWEARCTASGHGYVCVGGADDGNFAAIKVTGFPPVDPSEVDASLPLAFEHRLPRPPLLGAASRIRLDKVGDDIVNSISIHKLPAEGGNEAEVVAVLTNNDKTVRIYSLTQDLELMDLRLPFAMNHATISPDGGILVAVGDAPMCFFFERVKTVKVSNSKPSDGQTHSIPPIWRLLEQVSLYRPATSLADGYFTTAWSPSGRLCAVGSESGYISIFDVELLKTAEYGEDAIVQVISSTRPDTVTSAGAVRTMHFSPAPWDFLVWSEDQDRVCVADLRSGLKTKQILTLDPREEGLEKVEIADFDLTLSPERHELRTEADFIRGFHSASDSGAFTAATNAARAYHETYREAEAEGERHRRLGVVESDNDPHGLTPHERQVLETLRHPRHREEGITPRSINYTSSGHRDSLPRPIHGEVALDMLNYLTTETSLRSNRRTQERTTPRRQASVVVSIDEGTVNAPPHTHTHITDSALTRSPNPVPTHARRVTNEIMTSTDRAWHTIEDALAGEARAANASSNSPTGPELRNEIRRLRQLTQMRERLRVVRASQPSTDSYEFGLGLRRTNRTTRDANQGVWTAGLAMSQDGRTLYCGTEEGIFEFKMNLHVRKAFPAVTLR